MFNLNKSFAQLKSFLEENDLKKDNNEIDKKSLAKIVNDSKLKKSKNLNQKTKKFKSTIEKNQLNQKSLKNDRGIILIKNFPHGFYEKEMFNYFSQFGEVTRLKIIRSRKTGKPKNYGFIEFAFKDVAKIAAETMNNYLMFDHIVKCVLVTNEKIGKNVFKNWDRPFISSIEKHKIVHNQTKTIAQEFRSIQKNMKRLERMENILKEKNIEFKCVVVNRPSKAQMDKYRKQLDELKINSNLLKRETIRIRPSINMNQIKRRRLIIPKLMKIRAACKIKIPKK